MRQTKTSTRNLLLQRLPQEDLQSLTPYLEAVNLEQNYTCISPGKGISHVYFLDGGLGSTVIPDEIHGTSEIGAQGFEGLIGVPAVLGSNVTPHQTFMQVGGPARRLAVAHLESAMNESPALRKLLLLYAHVFMVQVAQTAYTNARYNVDERLSRWILMSSDRLGGQLALTHEFLSFMLGIRRSSVSDALHILEGEGLIRASRGLIEVRDRRGVEQRTNGCYGIAEAEYERLIGPWR